MNFLLPRNPGDRTVSDSFRQLIRPVLGRGFLNLASDLVFTAGLLSLLAAASAVILVGRVGSIILGRGK